MSISFFTVAILIFLVCIVVALKPNKTISLFGGLAIAIMLIYLTTF
jgi:hypothetical protein